MVGDLIQTLILMKKDYSLLIWAIIIAFCAFVSSCDSGEPRESYKAKCKRTDNGCIVIKPVHPMIVAGDTLGVPGNIHNLPYRVVVLEVWKTTRN